MKRVMHIAQAPGGVERYLQTLLAKLDKTQYENILVCSQSYDKEKFHDIAECVEIVEMYRNINFFNEIKAIFQIRKLIKKYNPDIVYMHSSKAGAVGRIANIGLKNISIYNAHGWSFNMKTTEHKKKGYAIVERLLAPLCTKIIAISDFEKKSALEWGICAEEKIRVICNGIDIDEYESVLPINREEMGIPQDAFVVGMVGRLTQQKAPDVFVKAASEIKKIISNAFFVIVGNGEMKDEIEILINNYEMKDSFLITGWVNNPMAYIKNFDVAMLLSRWEGFGLVLAEYMLAGKPIVATNVDAIPDVIRNGENGIIIDSDDYNSAADSVIKLYENKELYQLYQNNGKRCVIDKFDCKRVALEHMKLFKEIV